MNPTLSGVVARSAHATIQAVLRALPIASKAQIDYRLQVLAPARNHTGIVRELPTPLSFLARISPLLSRPSLCYKL